MVLCHMMFQVMQSIEWSVVICVIRTERVFQCPFEKRKFNEDNVETVVKISVIQKSASYITRVLFAMIGRS